MVMAPCGVLVDLVSDRHLITMDVDDMDTWPQRTCSWSDLCRRYWRCVHRVQQTHTVSRVPREARTTTLGKGEQDCRND